MIPGKMSSSRGVLWATWLLAETSSNYRRLLDFFAENNASYTDLGLHRLTLHSPHYPWSHLTWY